jgi:phospholipid-binding lipoprotein MlaA
MGLKTSVPRTLYEIRPWWSGALAALAALLVCGCASNPDRDPQDPLEPYNRAMFRFNNDFDKAFIRPVAKGYKAVVPEPVDRSVTNFLIISTTSHLL